VRLQAPCVTTLSVTFATNAEYDAAAAWLTAATPAILATRDIASWVGTRSQRRIVFTALARVTDIETSIPIAAV
jgi:hypothetical protein